MATLRLKTDLQFEGGWDTETGPNAAGISHLLRAENCLYSLDGAPYKMPGGAAYNSSAITETSVAQAVTGLVDFWLSTAWPATQKFVCVAGTRILKDDGDGTWDELKTGLTAGAVPSFAIWQGSCIISDDSGALTPQVYDQSTIGDMAGTPTNFPFCVHHKQKLWAPDRTLPSRLKYTVNNTFDWTGSGSGSIDIEAGDGDIITGLASHKGELLVFKGPNIGSIHRITGSSPSDYARVPFISADGKSPSLPCISHNSIIRIGDDLAFVSPFGVHSLAATANYGDYQDAFLSTPIRKAWRELVRSRDKYIWGVNHSAYGMALFAVTEAGGSANTAVYGMDYRFQPPRWFSWPATDLACLAIRKDTTEMRRLYGGTYTGYAVAMDQATRTYLGAAYTYAVDTPHMHLGEQDRLKSGKKFRLSFVPTGNFNLGVTAYHDDGASETLDVNLGGSSKLLDSFILDTDTLGSGAWTQSYIGMSGDWRTIQLQLRQTGSGENVEPHGLGILVTPGDLPEV